MEDSEALFESISRNSAADAEPIARADQKKPTEPDSTTGGDKHAKIEAVESDDPWACAIMEQGAAAELETASSEHVTKSGDIFKEIGSMARALHSGLQGLGYDKTLGALVEDGIPDVRSRLQYVNEKTEEAAAKTILSAESAQSISLKIQNESSAISRRWSVFLSSGTMDRDTFKAMIKDTLATLGSVGDDAKKINAYMTDVVIAQGFQDLTGQVIKKVIDTTEHVESQLVNLLIAVAPPEKKDKIGSELMQGPSIKRGSPGEIMSNQEQVDDLLASLGF